MLNNKKIEQFLNNYSDHEIEYLQNIMRETPFKTETEVNAHFSDLKKVFDGNIYTPVNNTLTALDFKKQSRYNWVSNHQHDYIEMNYVYSGTIFQTINSSETLILKKNDLIILDTQVSHSIDMAGKYDILLAFRLPKEYFNKIFFKDFTTKNMINDFLLKSLYESHKYNRYLLFNIDENEHIKYLLLSLVNEFISDNVESELVKHHYMSIIFSELIRLYNESESEKDYQNKKSLKIYGEIVNYLEQNYKNVTLTNMADFFGYHPNYLSTLIKAKTTQSFSELLLSIRLKNAALLLQNTSLTISAICEEIGLSNSKYFYCNFRKKYDCTPKEFRKNCR